MKGLFEVRALATADLAENRCKIQSSSESANREENFCVGRADLAFLIS